MGTLPDILISPLAITRRGMGYITHTEGRGRARADAPGRRPLNFYVHRRDVLWVFTRRVRTDRSPCTYAIYFNTSLKLKK